VSASLDALPNRINFKAGLVIAKWRGKLSNQVPMGDCPGIVERRTRQGGWELDGLIGK